MRDGTRKFSERELVEFRRRYLNEKLTEARRQYLEGVLNGEHKEDDNQ